MYECSEGKKKKMEFDMMHTFPRAQCLIHQNGKISVREYSCFAH